MGNLASQTFYSTGSFTAPAGVTSVTVTTTAIQNNSIFFPGSSSTIFLDQQGNVHGMGNNASGQLGNNASTNVSSPVLVVGGLTFTKIYTSPSSRSCFGIANSGAMYAWGDNTYGQLGDGTVTSRSSPVKVLGGLTFSSLYVDDNFGGVSVYGLTPSGKLYAWGDNTSGKLGINNTTTQSSPIAVVGGLTFSSIYGDNNDNFIIALTTAGAAYGWGNNAVGYLGDNTTTSRSSPVPTVGSLTFKSITTFESGVIGLTTSGIAYGWGSNSGGMLGIGNTTNKSSPTLVVGGLTFAKIVGGVTVNALTTTGAAYGWGTNPSGQIGDGTVTSRSSPVAVVGGLTFVDISTLATSSTYALTASGTMYSWGLNTSGRLGTGNSTDISSPVAVVGGLTWASLPTFNNGTALANSVVAQSFNGSLYGWGANTAGILGLGDITNRSSPVQVVGGLSALAQSIVSSYTFPVTPGSSYTVQAQPNPYFGQFSLGSAIPSYITVYFEE